MYQKSFANRMDRRRLTMFPLSERKHKLVMDEIAISPNSPTPELPAKVAAQVERTVENIIAARANGRPVMLTYGAHLIKNGLAPVVIRLLEDGWITHIATNGAGSIHDWEFAYLGKSTESVRANTASGQFGTWDETGTNINLAVAVGGIEGLGYGSSVGKMVADDGISIPSKEDLKERIVQAASKNTPDETLGALSDMLYLVSNFDIPNGRIDICHPFKEYCVQYSAWKKGIPFTVHPGIGYDIIYTHPMNCGGAIGRDAVRDFLSFADSVSNIGGGGVHLAVGSAIMAPMIFEKSLSMSNNLSIKDTGKALEEYYLTVVDIADGGDWDWSQGEPPMDNPAYYLRFCKSFYRMGGALDYICLDNRAFMLGLYHALKDVK